MNVTAQLIQEGADVNVEWNGVTPLYSALNNNSADSANLLMSKGADIHKAYSTAVTLQNRRVQRLILKAVGDQIPGFHNDMPATDVLKKMRIADINIKVYIQNKHENTTDKKILKQEFTGFVEKASFLCLLNLLDAMKQYEKNPSDNIGVFQALRAHRSFFRLNSHGNTRSWKECKQVVEAQISKLKILNVDSKTSTSFLERFAQMPFTPKQIEIHPGAA